MKKFELEDKLIEQQQSTNIIERLTLHIDKLWTEIGEKQTRIYELNYEIDTLKANNKKMSDAIRRVIKEKKPGQSFLDWLDTKPKSYFQKIPLGMKEGGEVIDFLSYLKQKEKPRIKRLNLDSVAPGKALSELTEAEREVVRNLLRMSFKD